MLVSPRRNANALSPPTQKPKRLTTLREAPVETARLIRSPGRLVTRSPGHPRPRCPWNPRAEGALGLTPTLGRVSTAEGFRFYATICPLGRCAVMMY